MSDKCSPDDLELIRSRADQEANSRRPFSDREDVAPGDTTRILVLEDSDDHSELLLRQLRKAHLDSHVKIIRDGQEAWDFLSSVEVCSELVAIFLDLRLPSLDGVQLLRQIRKSPRLHAIPVIVISSSDNPAEYDQCRALKVSAFISKPVSFPTFSKAVADVFHSTESRQPVRPE